MQNLLLLSSLLFSFLTVANASEGGVCLDCHEQGPPLLNHVDNRLKRFMCQEIGINKPVVVHDELGAGYVGRSYRLTKTAPAKFLAEINPTFYPVRVAKESDQNYLSRVKDVQNTYAETMTKCFKAIAPYLKSPSGERLEIKLSKDKKVPHVAIQIKESGLRNSSRAYKSNVNCPTMLHETLHLFGLADEYAEEIRGVITDRETGEQIAVNNQALVKGAKPAFECRAVTPSDSIMNDAQHAVRSLFPSISRKLEWCRCYADKAICESSVAQVDNEKFNKTKEVRCPKNYKYMMRETSVITEGTETANAILEMRAGLTQGEQDAPDQYTDIFQKLTDKTTVNKPKRSILKAAHFRFITNPFCLSKVSDYLKCASLTHKNKNLKGECPPKTNECKRNYDWLNL